MIGSAARFGKLITDDAGGCIVTGNQQLPLRAVNDNGSSAGVGNVEPRNGNRNNARNRLDVNGAIDGGIAALSNAGLARLQIAIKVVN